MNVARAGRRLFSSSNARQAEKLEVHPGYKTIKERQKVFQVDNGLLVRFSATIAIFVPG